MAKNTHDNHINMVKGKDRTNKEVDGKHQHSIIDMRGLESSKGVGLEIVRLNVLPPQKILLTVPILKSPRMPLL